jgi:transcriptional regulator of acetoin/glycerol metabolism
MWDFEIAESVQQDAVTEEVDKLWRSRQDRAPSLIPNEIAESWKRCLANHRLLPDAVPRPSVLTQLELRDLSDNHQELLAVAGPEVEKLFRRLIDSDYLVSLASPGGVMMLFRCDYQLLSDMSNCGVLPGSVWSEDQQGTNGVGTCLALRKPVTVVQSQHYGDAPGSLTCLTAPIFGKNGTIESVLNVTTPRDGDDRTNRVVQNIVVRTARRIENRYFGRLHKNDAILRISDDRDCIDLAEEGRMAVNESGIILAGTSHLEKLTGRAIDELIGRPVYEVLDLGADISSIRPDEPFPIFVNGQAIHAALADPQKRSSRAQLTVRAPDRRPVRLHSDLIHDLPPIEQDLHFDTTLSMALDRAQKLLHANLPLVVHGESGTGKSTFVQIAARRALGQQGTVTIMDCAMPSGESVLNAMEQLMLISGAIILDRIDQLDEAAQVALLPVLENRMPGNSGYLGLISVTSTDLDELSKAGKFRPDLLHRIKGASIELQPLRSMPDLDGAIDGMLRLESAALGRSSIKLEEEARLMLSHYHWPGNIRQMRHSLRHAVALADGTSIGVDQLPADIVTEMSGHDLTARSQAEASRIEAALRFNNGNVTLTARHLGVSRATLYRKIHIRKVRDEAS